jgi:hypothetical protein
VADFLAAKRGDLVLVVEDRRDVFIGQEAREYVAAVVGVVASIDRLGFVKRYLSTWGGAPCAMPVRARALVVSKADIDVTAAFEAARAHTWPGHTQPKPFDSIDEAREFLRPFKR